MKISLVEPIIIDQLTTVPNLGCALLISNLTAMGHQTKLVTGQTNLLKKLFTDNFEELHQLLTEHYNPHQNLVLKNSGILDLKQTDFEILISELYSSVFPMTSVRNIFESEKIRLLQTIFREIMITLNDSIIKCGYQKQSIITHYINLINDSSPDVVGFSIQGKPTAFLKEIIKRVHSDLRVPVIIGGAQTPYWTKEELFQFMEECMVDFAVIGQADNSLPELLNKLSNHKDPDNIPNLIYKIKGQFRYENKNLSLDLNYLPYPDFDQFDLDLYLSPERIIPLISSRGCSWNRCTFCTHQKYASNQVKYISIQEIVETIKYLSDRYKTKNFVFNDAEITSERFFSISEALVDQKLGNIFNLSCLCRFENAFLTEEIFSKGKEAGFTTITWGLESASNRIRELMKKGESIELCTSVLKLSARSGIRNFCFLIFGFPGETIQEANDTLKYIEDNVQYIQHSFAGTFNLNRFSTIGRNIKKWGIETTDYQSYTTKSGMSQEEAKKIFTKFLFKAHLGDFDNINDRVKCFGVMHFDRDFLYLLFSHHPISLTESKLIMGTKNFIAIYPIFVGEIIFEDDKYFFIPRNIYIPLFFANNLNKEKIFISNEIRQLIIRADGQVSLHWLLYQITEVNDIYTFFEEAINGGFVLFFERPWKYKPF